jgi:tetratricopeptide (TPR) repeat protein
MQTDPAGARRLVDLARDAERRGDTAKSLGLYDDAIEALEREQDIALLADALRWKGTLHREQGETEAAYRCYTQSLINAEKCGSVSCRAHGFNCLAIVAQRRGNLPESEKLYLQAEMCACSE